MTSNNIIEKPHKLFPLLWVTGILIAACVLLFYFLQSSQEFYYFYREQQQIFLFENDYILKLLKPIGGFAAMVGQWLVQFFVLPYMGAVISTLLSLMAAIFLGLTLRKLDQKNLWWISLTFLPLFLYIRKSQEDLHAPAASDPDAFYLIVLRGAGVPASERESKPVFLLQSFPDRIYAEKADKVFPVLSVDSFVGKRLYRVRITGRKYFIVLGHDPVLTPVNIIGVGL